MTDDYLSRFFAYRFKDASLLEDALRGLWVRDRRFERLEFLGDRVLALSVAQLLFENFPDESEGDLAKRHSVLVSGRHLRLLVNDELRQFFAHQARERKSKKPITASLLEDVMEAIVAAIYLDGGFAAVVTSLAHVYHDDIERQRHNKPPVNAKSALQEWVLQRAMPLPHYQVTSRMGKSHNPTFVIAASVKGQPPTYGMASSKSKAEQKAAKLLLKKLQEKDLSCKA